MKKKMIWHIYASYLAIIILSVVMVSGYASRFFKEHYLIQIREQLEAEAHQFVKLIAPNLFNDVEIEQFCKTIGKNSRIRLTVILPSGKVIGDSWQEPAQMDNHVTRPEVKSALNGGTGYSLRYSETYGKQMMYVALPMIHEHQVAAVLRTATDAPSIEHQIRKIQIRIVIFGTIIAIVAAGIGLLVSRQITRPIKDIQKGIEKFGRGELTSRIYPPKIEELECLAESMNQMAYYLYDRIMAVMRQRNELEAVLSSMTEGIVAVNSEEKILRINPAGARMFRTTPEKMIGKSIQELVLNPTWHRFVKNALSGQHSEPEDIWFYHSGEIFSVHSAPLKDIGETPIGTLIVFSDVTKFRKLETMRRDFAANVSHELKTPLTAIQGFVETLRSGAMNNPQDAARFLEIIENHVHRLAAIIDDLMELSKIEQMETSGDVLLQEGSVKSVIDAAVRFCQPKAETKNIVLEVNCPDNLTAYLNASLLEHALLNLIDNAIRYSHPDSRILISADSTEQSVSISVQDFGIGIPKEHHERIFERFYRVDKSRSRKQGGTGLGLSIVKHVVQAHEGTISVDSSPGNGSTFVIHLKRTLEI